MACSAYMKNFVSLFLCAAFAAPVSAGELIHSSIEHKDERYILEFDMRINADAGRVYKLVTDYNNLGRVNNNIEESELLSSSDPQHHRVRVVSDACVLFFCKTIRQVQDIEEINGKTVIATIIPEQSDFDYAHARWHIQDEGKSTRVTFNVDLKPSFWVPPLIGPAVIKSKLEDEVLGTIENLEKLANQHDIDTVQ